MFLWKAVSGENLKAFSLCGEITNHYPTVQSVLHKSLIEQFDKNFQRFDYQVQILS